MKSYKDVEEELDEATPQSTLKDAIRNMRNEFGKIEDNINTITKQGILNSKGIDVVENKFKIIKKDFENMILRISKRL